MKQKPYKLLLWAAFALVLASFFITSDSVDIHLHDTYFIIAVKHLFWALGLIAVIIWALYKLTFEFLFSRLLTWVHIIATIITLIILVLVIYSGDSLSSPKPRQYYDYSNWNSLNTYNQYAKTLGILLSIVLIGQVAYLINLIGGLIKRRN